MKLIKKQISGITYFSIDNLSILLDVSKRYNINLWSEGTQKQGNYAKTLYFDDTLEEWRTRDCECSNKDKSLDFSIVIENNTLKSLETLKIYGIDNGGVHIFNEVYCELNEIGGSGGTPITELPIKYEETYDPSKVVSGYLTSFSEIYNVLYYKLANGNVVFLPTSTYRWEGEILGVTQNGNNLVIRRQGIGNFTYSPIKVYSHSIMIARKPPNNTQVMFQVLSNLNESYDINNISNNNILRTNVGIPAVRVSSPTTADMIIFKSNGTQFVINGTENWDIADCVLMADNIVDLTNTDL